MGSSLLVRYDFVLDVRKVRCQLTDRQSLRLWNTICSDHQNRKETPRPGCLRTTRKRVSLLHSFKLQKCHKHGQSGQQFSMYFQFQFRAGYNMFHFFPSSVPPGAEFGLFLNYDNVVRVRMDFKLSRTCAAHL